MSTYKGKIEQGKVVFIGLVPAVPEGTLVDVSVETPIPKATEPASPDPFDTLGDDAFEGGPEDGSVEHDHYIYGTPKRSMRDKD